MNVRAMISGHMTNMPLVDSNIKTVWVVITGKIIKRHRVKHRVEDVAPEPQECRFPEHTISKAVPWYIRVWNWIKMNILGEES